MLDSSKHFSFRRKVVRKVDIPPTVGSSLANLNRQEYLESNTLAYDAKLSMRFLEKFCKVEEKAVIHIDHQIRIRIIF